MQQFGVKNITNSLASSGVNKSSRKRKGKPVVTYEKDVEYIPEFATDNEDNYEEEISKNVKVHKKVHPNQYIAPMSMNKFANLARKRTLAQNAPHVLRSSKEGTNLASSNVAKESRIQTFVKNQLRNNKSTDISATQQNLPRENMSMAELILKKNCSQKKSTMLEHNLVNSSSSQRSTLCGARRKLFLVDNNDEDDDGSSKDENEADVYKDYDEDDENEHIHYTIDVNEFNSNLEYDKNEEIDQFIYENDDNREDGLEDDLELEDDEPAQEQTISYRPTKETAISNTKKRGPTMLHKIHTRSFDERQVIVCNEFGQPIGPIVKKKNMAEKFSRFLGTIARSYSFAPLIHASWHKVPRKEKMWEYVLTKYIVPKEARNWALQSIGASWRVHKCRIKNKHFYKYMDNKSRLKNRPKSIPERDFATLLRLWSNKETMERCTLARDRRKSQKNNHTAGPKSFAIIREELRNEDPDKEPPTLSKMFEYTRRRTEGNLYVDAYDDTAMKIEKMKNYKPCEEESSEEVNPFIAVMGKEYSGHRRLYGKGVTNKLIKKVSGCEELIVDMRRELDEEQEIKKLELDEKHQRKKAELEAIRNDIGNQHDKSIEDAVQRILQRLPLEIVQKYLT